MSVERELKLTAGPGFHLPDFSGIEPAVHVSVADEMRMETTYYDTADLRLARWRCSLSYRSREGWTLKLPTDASGPLLERTEITIPGGARTPPPGVLQPVRAYIRRHPEYTPVSAS